MGQCSSTLPTNHHHHHQNNNNNSNGVIVNHNHNNNNGMMISETTTPTGGTTSSTNNQYDMRDRDVGPTDHHSQQQHHHNKRGNHPNTTNSSSKNHGVEFNVLSPTTNVNDSIKSRKMLMNHNATKSSSYYHNGMGSPTDVSPQSRDPPSMQQYQQQNILAPMDIDTRDDVASPVSNIHQQQQLYNSQFMIVSQLKYPLPPNAIRTRCYKLNLNAEPMGFPSSAATPSTTKSIFLGPFTETLPTLTFSSDDTYDKDDEDEDNDDDDINNGTTKESRDIAVAIQTAQIFRGITVSPDGTILSQNARATRSSRGNAGGASSSTKVKLSEKSRQAAKIDKANDLIEKDGSGDAKLVSLVVMGEYDDMKHLVRDGSRKLREADGLPDEALYAINRPRVSTSSRIGGGGGRSPTSTTSSSAHPTSTIFTSNNRGVTSSSTVVSSSSSSRRRRSAATPTTDSQYQHSSSKSQLVQQQQQQLPKLKSNPRDTTSSTQRRASNTTQSPSSGLRGIRLDSCNDFIDVNNKSHTNNTNRNNTSSNTNNNNNNTVISGFGSDNDDWTHAWNLWNCGGGNGGNGGTSSPLQPSSPNSTMNHSNKGQQPQQHHDSRNDTPSYGGGYNSSTTTRRVG